jgi:hypothetical protein
MRNYRIALFGVVMLLNIFGIQANNSSTVCAGIQTCAAGFIGSSDAVCYQACPPPGCPLIENCGNGVIQDGLIYCLMGN